MTRINGAVAATVVAALALAGCSTSITAGPASVAGDSIAASTPPPGTVRSATPAPSAAAPSTSAPSTTELEASAREWCATEGAPELPGPADVMVPGPVSALVVCQWQPPSGGVGSDAAVVQVATSISGIVDQLNAIPVQGNVACTLIGGGGFSAVFVGPAGPVRVTFDRVNCVSAGNGSRSVVGVGEVIQDLDTVAAQPTSVIVAGASAPVA